MPFFTSTSKSKKDFLVEINKFFPDLPIKKTTLRLLYALLNVKKNKNKSSLTMEIKIIPRGVNPPFILTDDNIFDLFNSDLWSTVVRITKNCIGTINKFLRRSCCTNVINFIKAFNASIKPVLEDQGVQDLNSCNIVLENNDPTNIFYPCEASHDSYNVIDMFLKCWDHESSTASELLRQRQQPTTHEDKYEDEDYDAVRRVWDVGGRKRTRRRQKRVRSRQPPRSRSRVRQPRRRRTK